MDSQTKMKQVVADAAIREVKSDMILGLGSGSTAALMIKSLADEIRLGKLQNRRSISESTPGNSNFNLTAIPNSSFNS